MIFILLEISEVSSKELFNYSRFERQTRRLIKVLISSFIIVNLSLIDKSEKRQGRESVSLYETVRR